MAFSDVKISVTGMLWDFFTHVLMLVYQFDLLQKCPSPVMFVFFSEKKVSYTVKYKINLE